MVDVAIGGGEGEGFDEGCAEVVVRRERLLILTPFEEEYIGVKIGGARCTGTRYCGRHLCC